MSIYKDEMVIKFNNDYRIDTLGRSTNKVPTTLNYYQIIYTTSGCYGSCSITNLSLFKNGTLIISNEEKKKKRGVFEGKLDKKFHQFLVQKINEANLLNLNANYEEQITDQSEDLLLVIKNDRIIKSVRVYAYHMNPFYNSFIQTLGFAASVTENKKNYHESEYFPLLSTIKMGEIQLNKVQTFLLWTELMKHPSEKMIIKNQQTYKTEFYYYYFGEDLDEINPFKLESIKGNGQQFVLKFENNQSHYYNLGYNFIQRYL